MSKMLIHKYLILYILIIGIVPYYNINGQTLKKASHHHCKKVQVSDTIFLVKETEKILIVNFRNTIELKKDRDVSVGSDIQIWDWKNNKPNVQYWNHPKIFYKTQNLYSQQKKELLDILYGNENGDHLEVYFDEFCSYAPRHAMVFYGKNDKVLGYLEMCFECKHFKHTSNLYFGNDKNMCEDKINALEKFFENILGKTPR